MNLNNPQYIYNGNDLGVTYSSDRTKFRVWAPTANRVQVALYSDDKKSVYDCIYDMEKDINGTWIIELDGDYEGKYFIYKVYLDGQINEAVDPYTRAVGTNSRKGLIVDLEKTNPEGWSNDHRVNIDHYGEAIIYEIHLRDFSSSEFSGIKNRGKYLGFTERGTRNPDGYKTGLDHLKELGITHIHLLPVFDFASVDDEKDEYNWGYDPYYYNVPEGSYATDPADESRIVEFKKMVKALHQEGIGVVMDVVYNHTFSWTDSCFNLIVPDYYYRFTGEGCCANGSGCGNEIASEKPMVRKFIIDSLKYWANEYHIDGFRFDLMALIDRETMELVEKTLHSIDSSILIYGEPWTGGRTPLPADKQLRKGVQQGKRIAVFNDHFRNAIKGDNDGEIRGFISGKEDREDAVKKGVTGGIEYNHHINNFCLNPTETVNYVSSHDNLTLWDKLAKSNTNCPEIERIKMDRLAQAIILTSQGMAFLAGGEEFLRTKFGNHNSYNAGDQVNQLKWERKSDYLNTYRYYQGLIKLRKNHPAFQMSKARLIRKHLEFLHSPLNSVSFVLKNHANGDSWEEIVVIYNPEKDERLFNLPADARWNIVVNDVKAGTEVLSITEGYEVRVKPISGMVLYR